ncbi:Dynein regulatory complex subunit 7 [Trichoplax sp. H2]|nr:Dynein regulatory complex subunit 7 [Trichoplax sp. H2]|eukprot:RDD44284.1 Dynein regulatory complex subunit 7 [Trichoplax sp. H2]
MEELKKRLASITIEAPKIDLPNDIDVDQLPLSYTQNSQKEELILSYCDNFKKQFAHLYRDRKPLFMTPLNECGIEKLICTSLHPTELPYKELYTYDGAATFVSDFLTFEPLTPTTEPPNILCSSTTILRRQKGNSFDFSMLLCSLLLGVGYDAYCVLGYASRETTYMDQSREFCPLITQQEELVEVEATKEQNKYTVKPPKDLRSKYLRDQDKKRVEEIKNEENKQKEIELKRIAALEKPKPDPLHGLRVHCWVMILSGKREVAETFFIEPLTGQARSAQDDNYLGIECVWNNLNFWVNMQDCSEGVQNMIYDLGDPAKWEFLFPNVDKPLLALHQKEDDSILDLDDDEEEIKDEQIDLPPVWIEAIEISRTEYQTRSPQGKKTILYKRAKLEKFAEYLVRDGLITKLSIFDDIEMKNVLKTKEWFKHRKDKLNLRCYDHTTGKITEEFSPGRIGSNIGKMQALKEHTFQYSAPGPENERVMIFYSPARVDGLVSREETPTSMVETFKDRPDFLYYRATYFGSRAKKFGPAKKYNPMTESERPILKIVERFNRNAEKLADDDVAERIFQISDNRIQLIYHLGDNRITASKREFLKPANAHDKGVTLSMTPDMTSTFQVDIHQKQPKLRHLYEMLTSLISEELKSIDAVRASEAEVREILIDRSKEETASELSISVYDTDRNVKAKLHREELLRQQREEELHRDERELDYLAPFLAQIENAENITRSNAYELKEKCLQDLKQRLIDQANLIQSRFEKETQELQRKQAWYQQNQASMQKEDEEEYLNYCSEAMFRIHILELRLNRHKELAPHKYLALEQKLRSDPRLAEFFN